MHIPVLLNEVFEYLNPQPGENFVDCTFGFGGHTTAILEKNQPNGRVLAIEIDADVYKLSDGKSERLLLVNDSYKNIKEIVEEQNFGPVDGVLMDLGFSSWHIDQSGRGFSFQKDEPLIMSYTHNQQLTAEEIVNNWKENDIIKILREYGEERFAGRIAREIVEQRRKGIIKTTFQLVEIIKKAIPRKFQFGAIHPATRTFQALRIAVNDELENLKQGLAGAFEVLENNGRLAMISFQSLEDKIVKNYFRDLKMQGMAEILTKKPIVPSPDEIMINPRARSAKLRAIKKIIKN